MCKCILEDYLLSNFILISSYFKQYLLTNALSLNFLICFLYIILRFELQTVVRYKLHNFKVREIRTMTEIFILYPLWRFQNTRIAFRCDYFLNL